MYRLVTFIVTIAALAVVTIYNTTYTPYTVRADLLAKDDIPNIPLNGSNVTLGEIDIAVSPYDGYLPQNGTLTLSTAGANDIDFNAMMPEGMTAVITNTTATLTSHPVSIQQPNAAAVATAAGPAAPADTGGGGGDSGGSSGDDESE